MTDPSDLVSAAAEEAAAEMRRADLERANAYRLSSAIQNRIPNSTVYVSTVLLPLIGTKESLPAFRFVVTQRLIDQQVGTPIMLELDFVMAVSEVLEALNSSWSFERWLSEKIDLISFGLDRAAKYRRSFGRDGGWEPIITPNPTVPPMTSADFNVSINSLVTQQQIYSQVTNALTKATVANLTKTEEFYPLKRPEK